MEGNQVIIGVVILLVIGSFVPVFSVNEPYDAKEKYTVKEPYTATECESYELINKVGDINTNRFCVRAHNECLNRILGLCTKSQDVCDEYKATSSFDITNLDAVRGTWVGDWYEMCAPNQPLCTSTSTVKVDSYSVILDPTETKTVTYRSNYLNGGKKIYSANYNVPSKEICEEVTRYQDVEKERTITKYRKRTVSLVEMLFG
ncbi:MAG TPA: hypothetical protein ENH13_07085 [Euryarchaeota archaeon]|nr:hypothetical protein BMS3Bbin16_01218 [archaeon BMS3Bbin16]HDH28881.1 hypothetical protein [Euryarchaeota archaeon]